MPILHHAFVIDICLLFFFSYSVLHYFRNYWVVLIGKFTFKLFSILIQIGIS